MLTKAEIKHLQSLKLKKYRQNYDEFIIEGDKLTTEALLGNAELLLLIATQDWLNNNAALLPQHIKVVAVTEKVLQQISSLSTAPTVIGLVKKHLLQPEQLTIANKWILILDGINDPGNMGTIIRTADWFGINIIVCSEDCVDCFNPKVVQSTMGSLFRAQIAYTNLPDFLSKNDLNAVAATLSGDNLYHMTFNQSGALVVGSESHGISRQVLEKCRQQVTIPGSGKAESLNVGVATAIILAELRRTIP